MGLDVGANGCGFCNVLVEGVEEIDVVSASWVLYASGGTAAGVADRFPVVEVTEVDVELSAIGEKERSLFSGIEPI